MQDSFNMRKIYIYLFWLSFCWTMVIGQQKEEIPNVLRGCKECRISEGPCHDIIKYLRINQETDSIAVEIFKDEYKIDNMPYRQQEWLFKKNHVEIIRYFAMAENKKFHCKLNAFINLDPVLLME